MNILNPKLRNYFVYRIQTLRHITWRDDAALDDYIWMDVRDYTEIDHPFVEFSRKRDAKRYLRKHEYDPKTTRLIKVFHNFSINRESWKD